MTTSHMQIQPEVGEEENAGDRQNLMEEAQVMTIEDMMEMIPDEEGKERQRVIRTIEKMIEAREAGNQSEANYKRNHPSAFNVFNRLYSYAQTKQRDQ